jgi:type I restriction enzyme, S subunit
MSFPRYPKYKDSGVEWLGEVPEGWGVGAIKHFAETITDGAHISPETEGSVYPFVSTKDVSDEAIDLEGCLRTSESSYEYMVKTGCKPKVGDVLFSKDGTIGRTVVVRQPHDFVVASSLIIIRPNRDVLNPSFLNRLCQSTMVTSQVDSFVKGAGLPRLSIQNLLKVLGCFPPVAEQHQIAEFLDREAAKIDELVAEQRRLMELLKEKRQAVISHAVTKGLNPRAPMKPSGIEWLGDVPEHWKIGKCGFYISILSGFAFPSAGFTDDETATKLLRGTNVGVSCLKWDDTAYWKRTEGDGLDTYEMRAGDLVIGMDRPLISEGMRVAKVQESDLPCLLLQRVASLKSGKQMNTDYLMSLLSSEMFVAHFSPETTGVSVPHISPEQIQNFLIPVPPVDEQQSIAEFVQTETTRFDALAAEAQKAVDLLQERRTALISAAVTGQIDVRKLAAA